MTTRRDLLKQSAKLLWAAPTMTTMLAFDIPDRTQVKMYNAYFVQKTRPDQTYGGECNTFCRAWYDTFGGFEEFKQDIGGWWAFPGEKGW